MNSQLTPWELYAEGCVALIEALGPEEAARFLRQHREGIRDYTAERWEWLDPLSLEEARERVATLRAERLKEEAAAITLRETPGA